MGCFDRQRQNMRRHGLLGYVVCVVVLSLVEVVSATYGSNYENMAFVGVKPAVFDNKRTSSFEQKRRLPSRLYSTTTTTTTTTSGQGFAPAVVVIKDEKEEESLSSGQVKERLLDLLPRMRGEAEEFRQVESYVNLLEADYEPALTLDFFNLAMGGEWQLLFSTNLSGSVQKIRLRELIQRIDPKQLDGTITNIATWDLSEGEGGVFDVTGTFSVKCDYEIEQGSRMKVELKDHLLEPARGSKIPQDVQGLVGLLHRAMPTELFDPNDVNIDTTYLDADLKIVRLTGSRYEGIRNIFIRRNSVQINPTSNETK
uniref:Plastid lipid-associated protein/fibrillin conserved domain-containing protein n=1 Tax=Attheya septentrionalis TaxID=420275 RepID=A0A7S2XQJ7_9STRA|mmetsp:Transcript_2969/g.5402  ORF Transcript_2969/g.5402 Transcript_2969/m.5402 type:complete len:313 (+) Transcript_2969:210-1148(+)